MTRRQICANKPSEGIALRCAPGEPSTATFVNTPAFTRVYWSLLKDAADGPMLPERSNKFYDGVRNIGVANGLDLGDPASFKTSVASARASILSGLASIEVPFAITSNGGADVSTSANPLMLTGSAPVYAEKIYVNGDSYAVDYPNLTNWQLRVWLEPGTNELNVAGYDHAGNLLSNGTDTITVTYTGAVIGVDGKLVINEIMYHPAVPYANYIELRNLSTDTLSLGGLRIDGIDADIGYGNMIGPTGYVVVAGNVPGYQAAYGNAEVVVGEFTGTLADNGEWLRLQRPDGTNWVTIDQVRYDNSLPWPVAADGAGPSLQLIDPLQDHSRAANWAADTNRLYTPGAANFLTTNLPPFPLVWINEVMPVNGGVIVDGFGQADPWVELYNADTVTVDLAGMALADNYTNLAQWTFPGGATIAAGGRRLVWADAQPSQTTNDELHANFALNPVTGAVVLARSVAGGWQVVDALDYKLIGANAAYGSYPEGDPWSRGIFYTPTPGLPNTATSGVVRVRINEWMASNKRIVNPVTTDTDDWFELYNAELQTVFLGGYYLTDTLAETNMFRIPNGTTLAAGGYLLVWADKKSGFNVPGAPLHVNFALTASGEAIGLYAPDGTRVDEVVFGAQQTDISEGLWPDGSRDLYAMAIPTPGASNVLFVISAATIQTNAATLTWVSAPGRVYALEQIADLLATNWTPTGVITANSSSTALTDTNLPGVPQRFYRINQVK